MLDLLDAHFSTLLLAWIAVGALAFVALLWLPAPYGRHTRGGWGPTLPARTGWVLMELPALLVLVLFYAAGRRQGDAAALVFVLLWVAHYAHRVLIFPFRARAAGKRMPLLVALLAVVFNLCNGYFNGRWLFTLAPAYPDDWLLDPRFLAGAALFLAG